jgi:hypothetical protein
MTDETEGPEDWQARAETAEAALANVQAQANAKLIRAELKAEAIRAGMVDLDGLKLLDLADVGLNQNGEVADAAMILAKLKRAKPCMFRHPRRRRIRRGRSHHGCAMRMS